MAKLFFVTACVLFVFPLFAQPDTAGLDAETKAQLIYLNISDKTSSTTYQYTDGSTSGGGTTRVIKIGFKHGDKGEFQELEKDGSNLYEIIKNNRKAVTQFDKAYKCRKLGRLYNVLEITFEVGALGLVVVALHNRNLQKEGEDRKKQVIGSWIGVGVCAVGFYYCWYKAHKMLTDYSKCIERCVSAYNLAIIEEAKS